MIDAARVLTVRQPFASLIALGVKTIEARSWSTDYRGPLIIQAGQHRPEHRPRRLEPIPHKGGLGLRHASDELLAAVNQQLEAA